MINPPPIQGKPLNGLGFFSSVWVRWFDDIKRSFDKRLLWFDNDDAATASSPISHTGGATNTYFTNDANGAQTSEFNLLGISNIWDASTNAFDFSNLSVGDSVVLRVSLVITTSANNQEFDLVGDFAIGGDYPYSINFYSGEYKNSGTYNVSFLTEFYIGSDDVKDNPMKLRFVSDDNASIEVDGWYSRLILQ